MAKSYGEILEIVKKLTNETNNSSNTGHTKVVRYGDNPGHIPVVRDTTTGLSSIIPGHSGVVRTVEPNALVKVWGNSVPGPTITTTSSSSTFGHRTETSSLKTCNGQVVEQTHEVKEIGDCSYFDNH